MKKFFLKVLMRHFLQFLIFRNYFPTFKCILIFLLNHIFLNIDIVFHEEDLIQIFFTNHLA